MFNLVVMPQFSEKFQLVKIPIGIGKALFYLNKEEKCKPQEYFPKETFAVSGGFHYNIFMKSRLYKEL